MKNILVMILAFIIIELYYSLFVIKKKMKYDPNKISVEIKLLIKKYRLDMKKVNYYNLMKSIALINALDIGLVMFWVTFIEKLNVQCLVAIVLLIPTILISYTIFGEYLKKQGLTIDDKKENQKEKNIRLKKGKNKNENI